VRRFPCRATAQPSSYTPTYLAERIRVSKTALEGERKQVTVLFADLKGSMELLADRDPEEARITVVDDARAPAMSPLTTTLVSMTAAGSVTSAVAARRVSP
jgi:class 3 adenylate cyclase